jgi:N-acetylglucosamine malate deacetylase 1
MRILTLGAHPDDIEPQMGGTIAKYTRAGHDVLLWSATTPVRNIKGEIIEGAKSIRTKEAETAAKILGARAGLPDLDPYILESERNILQEIDLVVQEFKPDVIYTCWHHDCHQNHRAVTGAVLSSMRKNGSDFYMYESAIPGGIVPYTFNARIYVDISDTIEQKNNSIAAYKSQSALFDNWLEKINYRSRFRGSEIKTEHAEAFDVVKEIKKIPPANNI